MTLKNRSYQEDYNDDYDDEDRRRKKKLHQEHRRPVKNWKKVWGEHIEDYELLEEFFSR